MLLLNEWIKPTRTLNFRFNLYIVRQSFFIRYSHRKKKRSINYLCYKASWHKHVRTIQVAVNKWKTQLYEANSPYKYPVYKIDVKFRCRCAIPPISNFPSTDLKEGVQVGRQTFVAFRPSHLSSGSEVKTARVPNKLDPEATDWSAAVKWLCIVGHIARTCADEKSKVSGGNLWNLARNVN